MVESNASCSNKCSRHSVCSATTAATKSQIITRRRRHKTVHFGDNLLLQVCTNASLRSQLSNSKMEPNVEQLFSFIETVLSAWVAEEGLTSQGEVSETDEKGLRAKRNKKQASKVRKLDIRRLVKEVSKLNGTRLLGSLRYRHFHWKGCPDECNELFLRKVGLLSKYLENLIFVRVYEYKMMNVTKFYNSICVGLGYLWLIRLLVRAS